MNDDLKSWKRIARNFQQAALNNLGDRVYDRVNDEQLKLKVGYALYNSPSEVNENNKTASYTNVQQKQITLLCEKIKSLQPSVDGLFYFSCIYVVFRLKNKKKDVGVQTIFRLPKFVNEEPSQHFFIFLDPKPRTYESWELYLQKNKLPKCDMCFPTNGIYTETDRSVDLTFAESNSCNTRTAIFNGLDISSTLLLVGATGVSLASLAFPIATPVVWGAAATVVASGSYDAARKVYSLHDIKKHGEGLGFKNPDARSAWLNLAGSVVGMASIGTTAVAKGVLATESAISRAGIITLRVLNVSSLAVSGLGILNGIVTLVIKRKNGTLQTADIVQFTYTCLFFVNAVVTYNVASRLIDELSCTDVNSMFNLRENSCFQFTKNVLEFNDLSPLDILKSLVKGINSNFSPDLNFVGLESIVLSLSVLLDKFCSGKITWNQFSKEIESIVSNVWTKYEHVILNALEEIKNVFEIPYWQSLPRHETTNLEVPRVMCEEIDKVVKYCGIREHSIDHRNLAAFSRAFSLNKAITDNEFLGRFTFYCDCVIAQYKEEVEMYEDFLDSKTAEEGFNRQYFDETYGIKQGTRKEEFFFNSAMNKVNDHDFLENIDELYNKYQQEAPPQDTLESPFLKTAKSRLYTICGPLGQCVLEETFYWNKVTELTGFSVDPLNYTFRQNHNLVLIQPIHEHSTCELKVVLISTSIVNECHMGLLVLLLK